MPRHFYPEDLYKSAAIYSQAFEVLIGPYYIWIIKVKNKNLSERLRVLKIFEPFSCHMQFSVIHMKIQHVSDANMLVNGFTSNNIKEFNRGLMEKEYCYMTRNRLILTFFWES